MERNETWKLVGQVTDYFFITLGMLFGAIGWCVFLLPHHVTIGGIPGISSIIFWGADIPVQYTYFTINALLLLGALRVLGWRFCVRTIFAVVVFSIITSFMQEWQSGKDILFEDQPIVACLAGGVLMGIGMGLALTRNASSGGSDIVASMVNKYRNYSLGHVILITDLCVITASYLVIGSWEKVIYGYIILFVMSFCVDYVVNGRRGSVQFFVVSDKWMELGQAINNDVNRGCTVIDAHGFYTGKKIGMLFIIARRTEVNDIFRVIDEIDPKAFVSQSIVRGVYGLGFDRIKIGTKK